MAFHKVAKIETRDQMVADMRVRAGLLNPQLSKVQDAEMDEILHESVNRVFESRVVGTPLLRLYKTDETVAEDGSGFADISAQAIFQVIGLYDATHGRIDVEEDDRNFNWYKKHKSEFGGVLIARYSNIVSTNNKLRFEILRGADVASGGTLSFIYIRLPKKTTLASTGDEVYVDLPDHLCPLAKDVGIYTLLIRKQLSNLVPAAVQKAFDSTMERKAA